MRALIVGFHFSLYTVSLVEAMRSRISVYALLRHNNFVNEIGDIVERGRTQIRLFEGAGLRRPLEMLSNILGFRNILKEIRPDIVHFHEAGGWEESPAYWRPCASTPRVLTVHDVIGHPGRDSRPNIRAAFIRRYLR